MSTQYIPTAPAEQPTRSMSVPHLVMGLVFLGIAGAWLLHEVGVIESVQVQWVLPLVLVVAGAAGLLASVARTLTRPLAHPHPVEPSRSEGRAVTIRETDHDE